jgi:hypothetical protein
VEGGRSRVSPRSHCALPLFPTAPPHAGKDRFILDFAYPLSPYQAFAIVMASLGEDARKRCQEEEPCRRPHSALPLPLPFPSLLRIHPQTLKWWTLAALSSCGRCGVAARREPLRLLATNETCATHPNRHGSGRASCQHAVQKMGYPAMESECIRSHSTVGWRARSLPPLGSEVGHRWCIQADGEGTSMISHGTRDCAARRQRPPCTARGTATVHSDNFNVTQSFTLLPVYAGDFASENSFRASNSG